MMILTRPEEYTMDLDFGVGITNYLFEQEGTALNRRIRARILQQAAKYMPYISITDVSFDHSSIDNNVLGIRITYLISETELQQIFDLEVTL